MGVEVIELALKADPAGSAAARCWRTWPAARRWCWAPAAWARARSSTCWCRPPPRRWARSRKALAAGRHTTTTSTWYWLDDEHRGALIDTPGFQEFGLRHIAPERLASLMPDFARSAGPLPLPQLQPPPRTRLRRARGCRTRRDQRLAAAHLRDAVRGAVAHALVSAAFSRARWPASAAPPAASTAPPSATPARPRCAGGPAAPARRRWSRPRRPGRGRRR